MKLVSMCKKISIVLAVIICIVVLILLLMKPSQNKAWEDDSKILPSFEISSTTIQINNIRDWRYTPEEIVTKDYYDDTFDIQSLEQAYLVFNPFGKWEGVGHSFFVFEFTDGKTISVSVEARREVGEEYSALNGVFNQYELWYAFGSPADFFTRRSVYLGEDLYMYPLRISSTSAQALFVELASTAQSLEKRPRFYNTITSNCTNLLADAANKVKSNSIPLHISRLFTGYADDQLYDLGFIPNDKPFLDIFREARIDQKIIEAFGTLTEFTKEEFWNLFI